MDSGFSTSSNTSSKAPNNDANQIPDLDVSFKKNTTNVNNLQTNNKITFKRNNYSSRKAPDESIIEDLSIKFINDFHRLVDTDDIEFGITSKTELFVKESLTKSPIITRDSLSKLFLDSLSCDPKITIAILIIISHIAYEELIPQGQVMAIAALSNANLEVRECAIRAFENWENKESISILEQTVAHPEWLNDYLQQVIEDLKGI